MNNKYPQVILVFDRRKKATPSVKAPVELRISYDYKQKYISTGIMLYSNQWKNGRIVNCPDAIQISQTLDKLIKDVRQVIYEMMERGSVDIFSIPNELEKKTRGSITFLEFCNQRASIRKYGKEKDTQERYNRFIRLFFEWGKIRYFEDITEMSIISYDKYLASKGMKNYSKWQNYHRFLNSFILDAIDAGYLTKNPYRWISIEKDKTTNGLDKCLTPQEFRKLKDCRMPTECLERVRDLFVFQTYTCLRYSDLARFDSSSITLVNGTQVYVCTQKKTRKMATIPLLQPALDILSKYRGFLPVISNVKYNQYLKAVAQVAGIDKPLSTHWARHTGATILLNEGIPMQIVSKICGHSSTRITEQIYAKMLDETVVEAVDAVKHKL